MNIAILGGRFDPPHLWHYWIGRQVLEKVKEIDEVWYMPDFKNAFKPIKASMNDRITMLHYMEADKIKLSIIAIAQETITYTIDIVRELMKNKGNHYYWIVGSDIVAEYHRWRDYQQLSKMINFLVYPRIDGPLVPLPVGFSYIPGKTIRSNISSSLIRERLKNNLPVTGLVFPAVEEYIKKRYIYR